jgi:hypothetical protein
VQTHGAVAGAVLVEVQRAGHRDRAVTVTVTVAVTVAFTVTFAVAVAITATADRVARLQRIMR